MGGWIERIKQWWQGASTTQRVTTLGGIALTLAMFFAIFSVASKPRFAMLYGGLSQADQAAMVTEIQAMGIEAKYETPGQIEVPADQVARVRMQLASSGKVPKSAHLGLENLGDMNLYTTPAVERERIRAILEGELARSIETNPAVKSARVHITLGDTSPFADENRPPSASVSLITAGAGALNRDSAKGIAMMVANSAGINLKDIVVLDETAHPLYSGAEMNGVDAVASNKLELEGAFARREEQRLQSRLDRIFGAGATEVSVRCEVDMDEVRKTEAKQTVGKGLAIKSMKETMENGAAPGGAAGTESNLAPATSAGKEGGKYTSKVDQIMPTVTNTKTETEKSLGSIKSMVINVAANVGKFPAESTTERDTFVAAVENFVKNELSYKAGETGFVAKVTPVEFDNTTKTVIESAQKDASSAARLQQLLALLPIVALVVVGAMVTRQIGKLSANRVLGLPGGLSGDLVPARASDFVENRSEIAASTLGPEGSAARPAPSGLTAELASETDWDALFAASTDALDEEAARALAQAKEKSSHQVNALKAMAQRKPDATAMLIKTWMANDKS